MTPARVYDPSLGSFLQRDPLPLQVGLSRSTSGRNPGFYSKTIFARSLAFLSLNDAGSGAAKSRYACNTFTHDVDPDGFVCTRR